MSNSWDQKTMLIRFRYAEDVIRECAEAWERLVNGKTQAGGVTM